MSTLAHSCASRMSPFVSLPHEIHLSILDRVGVNTPDLCSLRATCHAFDHYIRPRLFATIHIKVSFIKGPGLVKLVEYAVVMKDVFKYVENVTVSEEDDPHKRAGAFRWSTAEHALETILSGIGRNRLRAFRWLCREGLSTSFLFKLIWRHGQALELFHVTSFTNSQTATRIISGLAGITSFAYCTMKSEMGVDARYRLKAFIRSNSTRLQDLSLKPEDRQRGYGGGFEGDYSFEDLVGPLRFGPESLPSTSLSGEVSVTKLKSLSICGIDMSGYARNFAMHIEWSPTQHSLPWEKLRSFSLLSCPGSEEMLDCLSRYFRSFQNGTPMKPALETFNFREINLRSPLRDSLHRFFTSFSGLRHISILVVLGSRSDMVDPSSSAIAHGKTLRTIALEQRRSNPHLCVHEYDGALEVICQHCPALEVLSVPLQRMNGTTVAPWKLLAELESLEVLHYRVAYWDIVTQIDQWVMEEVNSITDEFNQKQLVPSLQRIIVGNSQGLGYEMVPVQEPRNRVVFFRIPPLQFFNIAYSKVDEGSATTNGFTPSITCTSSYKQPPPRLSVFSENRRFGSLDAWFRGG